MKKLLSRVGPIGPLGVLMVVGALACNDDSAGPDGPTRIPAGLRLEPSSVTMEEGGRATLAVVVVDQDGEEFETPPAPVRWESSDTVVVTVDSVGTIAARKAGNATITVRTSRLLATAAVVVTAVSPTVYPAVVIEPDSLEGPIGDTIPLRVTAYDENGRAVSPQPAFTFESLDRDIARVNAKGQVKGRAVGMARITATAGNLADTARFYVHAADASPGVAAAVRVEPEAATVDVGQTVALEAVALDGALEPLATQPGFTWTSLNGSIASVDSAGRVRGVAAGTARVRVSAGDLADTATVTVTEAPPPVAGGPLPAFPGAEGWGATALQSCRSKPLKVIHVTNRNDSGAGSFRQAWEEVDNSRFNVIVFRVGGYITLSSRVNVSGVRCVYVAGQTAPGDGVTIRGGNGIRFTGKNEDVVIRSLRFRLGYQGDRLGHVGVYISEGKRFVLDHLSVSWTTDKLIIASANAPDSVTDISIQRTLLGEVLAHHPTALQITGEPRNSPPNDRISVHRNLLAHNSHRNPVLGTRNLQFINNIVYNWGQGASHSGGPDNLSRGDFVNNYYRTGPMTDSRFTYEVTVNCGTDPGMVSFYVAGNVGPHNTNTSATSQDQWVNSRVTACYYKTGGSDGAPIPSSLKVRRDTRLAMPRSFAPAVLNALAARDDVLADVGFNRSLTCEGDWTPSQDAVDARIVSQTRSGSGVTRSPTTEQDVGGYPSLRTGSACADSDNDGLPDAWEARYPRAADPRGDADGDGYTNIEEYLNGTRPL